MARESPHRFALHALRRIHSYACDVPVLDHRMIKSSFHTTENETHLKGDISRRQR